MTNHVDQPQFKGKSYDRSVFDADDFCSLQKGCKCYQCETNPVVVVCQGESSLNLQNVTLRDLSELVQNGSIQPLLEESFFVYSQFDHHGTEQFGVLAAVDVEDCQSNIVKRHEHVITKNFEKGKHLQREVWDSDSAI